MEANLRLLEKHRQKMGLIIGLIIFMFIYSCITIFFITAVVSWQKIEDQNLQLRLERVSAVAKTTEVFLDNGNEDSDIIISGILKDSNVIDSNRRIISTLGGAYPNFIIPEGEIVFHEGYKYISLELIDDGLVYSIIVRDPAQDITKLSVIFILFLIILSPFLYGLLAFIGCRIMHKVYAPIKEIVINLEGFATNINHEFKTSLTEILSSLELSHITKDYEVGVENAIASSKRLNNILDSLGILVRFVNADYRKQKVNLISLFNESINDYQKEIQTKELRIIKKYDINTSSFSFIDKEPALLCFNNILKNAIRYSHVGGNIEISISRKKFIIKDYGIGIEEKNLSKIYDRYFRENYAGTGSGIGLSLVKRIAERYNWKIEIKSEKGEYTEVSFYFQ